MTDKPQFDGQCVKLGDVATYINGYAFKPADYSLNGKQIIRIQDLTGNAYQTNNFAGELDDKYLVSSGDVLISWSASLGVFEWNKEEAWLNQHIFKVVFNKLPVDKRYFIHQARYVINRGAMLAHGATMRHLTKKVFESLPFSYPNRSEQLTIAKRLDDIQRQIYLAEKQISKLDSLVKSRFIEMFGDPIRNPLRMSVSSVEELAAPIKNSMKAGPFGSALKKEVYAESGYKVYGQEQVISGNQFLGNYYIDKEKYEQLNSCKVMPGDVLISLVGTVGKVLILSEDCQPGIINPRLVKITFDKRKIFPEYFAIAFSLESVRSSLLGRAHGQTMNVLNLGMIKKLKLPVPPISRQKEYLNFVAQVDKSRFGGMLHLLNSLSGIMHASFFSVADTD